MCVTLTLPDDVWLLQANRWHTPTEQMGLKAVNNSIVSSEYLHEVWFAMKKAIIFLYYFYFIVYSCIRIYITEIPLFFFSNKWCLINPCSELKFIANGIRFAYGKRKWFNLFSSVLRSIYRKHNLCNIT